MEWKGQLGDQQTFEEQIIGFAREAKDYKGTFINHPVLRYLQRCLGFAIFPRGDPASKFNISDIYFLYCMLHAHADPSLRPDVAHFMLQHIITIADPSTWIVPGTLPVLSPPLQPLVQPQQEVIVDPSQPTNQQLMNYLIAMNTGLVAKHEHSELRMEYQGLSRSHSSLLNKVAKMYTHHSARFDDPYECNQRHDNELFNISHLTSEMHRMHVKNNEILPSKLDMCVEHRLRHPMPGPLGFEPGQPSQAAPPQRPLCPSANVRQSRTSGRAMQNIDVDP